MRHTSAYARQRLALVSLPPVLKVLPPMLVLLPLARESSPVTFVRDVLHLIDGVVGDCLRVVHMCPARIPSRHSARDKNIRASPSVSSGSSCDHH